MTSRKFQIPSHFSDAQTPQREDLTMTTPTIVIPQQPTTWDLYPDIRLEKQATVPEPQSPDSEIQLPSVDGVLSPDEHAESIFEEHGVANKRRCDQLHEHTLQVVKETCGQTGRTYNMTSWFCQLTFFKALTKLCAKYKEIQDTRTSSTTTTPMYKVYRHLPTENYLNYAISRTGGIPKYNPIT